MIEAIEQLIDRHFRTIPFHNLNLLFGQPVNQYIPGGTCSDKTLAFLSDARNHDVEAHLHNALIGGKEIHRLVRIHVNGRDFFADVGNGWPAIKLIPADETIKFECFGMKYRTEISENWLSVFHTRNEKESLQMEVNVLPKPQAEIREQIRTRYSSGIEYPFVDSIRFSMIVENKFYFLRGNKLEQYSEDGYLAKEINSLDISSIIKGVFGFDASHYLSQDVNQHVYKRFNAFS